MRSRPVAVVEIDVLVDLRRLVGVAWSTAVDECLAGHAARRGHHDRPFGASDLALVVGRDDVEAAAAVLEARRIVLPIGAAGTDEARTLHGLARRKREVVATLAPRRARLRPDAEGWLARRDPRSVVVVAASQDAEAVVDAVGLRPRIAGLVGPPDPEVVVLEPPHRRLVRDALRRTGAVPDEVEVLAVTEPLATAARHEGVGRIVHVAHGHDARPLVDADRVVHDLAELVDDARVADAQS